MVVVEISRKEVELGVCLGRRDVVAMVVFMEMKGKEVGPGRGCFEMPWCGGVGDSYGDEEEKHGRGRQIYLYFLQLYCPYKIFPMDGKFGLPSLGKVSCERVALPNQGCMLGALLFP